MFDNREMHCLKDIVHSLLVVSYLTSERWLNMLYDDKTNNIHIMFSEIYSLDV